MNIKDLNPETIAKLGLAKELKQINAKPRQHKFTIEDVRSNALNVISQISRLNQGERARVLEHCIKLNSV